MSKKLVKHKTVKEDNIGVKFCVSSGKVFAILILGLVIIILCKKSKKFQIWAEKDVLSFAEHFIHKKR